jgi:hypothetical protein
VAVELIRPRWSTRFGSTTAPSSHTSAGPERADTVITKIFKEI